MIQQVVSQRTMKVGVAAISFKPNTGNNTVVCVTSVTFFDHTEKLEYNVEWEHMRM